ncbi:MAG: lysophospholipid acyltransferase family protein [Oscillospiraceae bacterium]
MTFQRFAQKLVSAPGRWLFGLKYTGMENIPSAGAAIVVSNHIHWMDPLLHAFCFKRGFSVMAKKELFKVKPIGWLLRELGAFPVERGHGDRGAINAAVKVLEDGKMLLIFPEGTRSRTGRLDPFKSGTAMFAATTKAMIIPAYIHAPKGIGLFRKTLIEYGKPIMPEELKMTEITSSSCKVATGYIRSRIEQMERAGKAQ